MSSQEELQESLKQTIRREVKANRGYGLKVERVFEVISDIYYELMGDLFLADHYGGEANIPPRHEPKQAWLQTRVKQQPMDPSERGILGGRARAESLSPERRSEIASDAAKARWDK